MLPNQRLVLRRLTREVTTFHHHCLKIGVRANSISNQFLELITQILHARIISILSTFQIIRGCQDLLRFLNQFMSLRGVYQLGCVQFFFLFAAARKININPLKNVFYQRGPIQGIDPIHDRF
jgi:hypothetical protein